MKRCKHCQESKPLDQFYGDKKARDGRRPECKKCTAAIRAAKYAADPQKYIARVKRWQQDNSERLNAYRRDYRKRPDRKRADRDGHLRRKFGIGLRDYEVMLFVQYGGCLLCGDPPPENGSLHVDHDHDTGEVRGLLCVSCNNALGAFKDSREILLRAVAYVDREPASAF